MVSPLLLALAAGPVAGASAIPQLVTISAPGGYWDKKDFALPCKNGRLSAVLRLKNFQFAGIWQATGAIIAQASDTKFVRLGTVTKNQKADRLYALWRSDTSPRTPISADSSAYLLQQDVNAAVRMEIAWTEQGEIVGALNGKTLAARKLSVPAKIISFFVVGADAQFDQVTVSCDLIS
jgi:hypothetical protein